MEGGGRTSKTFGAPTPDEALRPKEDVLHPSDYSSEYFNRVFSPVYPSLSTGPNYDLYRSLNKKRVEEEEEEEEEGSAQTKNSDSVLPGSISQVNHNHDGESVYYSNEPVESSCFGSSLNYGGRDFYITSSSPQTYGNIKSHGVGEVDDANVAIRGEWWQGSYHY